MDVVLAARVWMWVAAAWLPGQTLLDPNAVRSWDIVVADEATEAEKHAAKEFRLLFEQAAGAFPSGLVFGMVSLGGGFAATELGGKRLLRCKPSDLKAAKKFVAQLPGDGWCSQFAGLWAAASELPSAWAWRWAGAWAEAGRWASGRLHAISGS